MTRSKRKIPFINLKFFKKILKKKKYIKTNSRSTIIIPSFIGITIKIHNGIRYKTLYITEKMVGFKLGEFSFTRKVGKIHNLDK